MLNSMLSVKLQGICSVTLSHVRFLHVRDQSGASDLADEQCTEIFSYVCVYLLEVESN